MSRNTVLKDNDMINFNVPPFTGREYEYIKQAVDAQKICGDGQFTKKCNEWIEKKTGCSKALHGLGIMTNMNIQNPLGGNS